VGPPLHFPLPEWTNSPPVHHEGWMISDEETISLLSFSFLS
jgi:hypothetical protein